MTHKQKSYYKSLILTILGIFLWFGGFISAIVFGFVFKNDIAVVICICASLIGLIAFILDDNLTVIFQLHFETYPNICYKSILYGVPNNKLNEFQISINDICKNSIITAYENDTGKFKIKINDIELFFDLCGWHNKAYCLYEYFMSVIQVNFAKKNYKRMRKSIEINKISNLKLNIIFNNGKARSYALIKNNKSILTKKFKYRLAIKKMGMRLEKMGLNNLYDFNI